MKHLKLFFALFAMLALGVGNAWGAGNYVKVTTAPSDWSGDYLIVYEDGKLAFNGALSTLDAVSNTVDVTISNNQIAATDDINKAKFTINAEGHIKSASGYYIGQTSNANGLKSSKTTTYTNTLTINNDASVNIVSGGAYLRYNSASNQARFRYYKSSSYSSQKAIHLYKYVEEQSGGSTEPVVSLTQDQLKWSAETAEATIRATNTFPTLTNTLSVPVTYASSTPATATVDATTGAITLVAAGTTTISAVFAGGEVSGTKYAAKTVSYTLTVKKAPATPTENMYVKVTDAVTDGEYLIVYEAGNLAFNGALATLDAVSNTVEVVINSNTIAGNTDIDAATFTISAMDGGYAIKAKSGKYIGRTSGSNGMNTGASEIANDITFTDGAVKIAGSGSGSTTSLQYNATSGQTRFRYFTSSQKAIALYKKVDPNEIIEPQFKLAAGEYYGTQSVEITCATADAKIYYTLNGTDPTSASTEYTGAISIASTTTVKAIAVKGANSSEVVSATYTILSPLATMQAIFDKATDATQSVHIKFNDWVISGVVPGKDGKPSSNAYITDGSKGFIIYNKDGHGFNVGNKLSGTVVCDLTRYNGSAEVVGLTSSTDGLTVSTGGVVTPVVVNDVTTLGGVNTGSVIKITGPCTVDGTKYYVAGVQLYNSLYTYTNPEDRYNYECTGVYLQYNTTKEILPRKAEDLVKIETQQPAGIAFAVTEHTAEVGATDFVEPELTNPNSLTVTYKTSDATLATVNATTGEVTIGNKAGKVTITASFAGSDDFVAADASYVINVIDPSMSVVTFDATKDKTPDAETLSLTKDVITMTFTGGAMHNGENYRCYKDQTLTISAIDASIQKIEFECTSSNPISGFADATGLDKTNSVWTGDAKSIELIASNKQVRMSKVNVYYKKDNRAETGLAWNPATVSLTVGDAFTAPTFSNPNGLTVDFESDNTALATVTTSGVVSLNAGVSGKAVIKATYSGDDTYKATEVTCVITVNPKSEKVVILAEYNGQWYALKNAEQTAGKVIAALPVNYVGGKLYNVADADKATIEWQLAIDGSIATFKNGENYIFGTEGDTNLKLSTTECEWTFDGTTYMLGDRTFLYRAQANGFKNYNAEDNAGTDDYSELPVVTAPVYATGDAYGRTVTTGEYGTICIPYGSSNYTGAEFYEISWMEMDGTTPKGIWLDQVNGALIAGKPYIFKATADEIAIVGDGTTAAAPIAGEAGLTGTFTLIQDIETSDPSNTLEGNYMISGNQFLLCPAGCWLNANRAYIDASIIAGHTTKKAEIPGRRRVCLGETSENEATGFENIVAPEGQAVKAIVNGQLIIIRDGVKYNVQGQVIK